MATVYRFTEKTPDQVRLIHAGLEKDLGPIDTESLKLLQDVVSPKEFDFKRLTTSDYIDVSGFKIRTRRSTAASSDLRIVPNFYVRRIGEYLENDIGVSVTSTEDSIESFLNRANVSPSSLGLPPLFDIVSSRLEVDSSSYFFDMFFVLPFYFKVESLSYIPPSSAAFSARVHNSLLESVTVVLARKSGRKVSLERKPIEREDFKVIEKNHFALIECHTSFKTIESSDIIAADLAVKNLGIVNFVETPQVIVASEALQSTPTSMSEEPTVSKPDPKKVFVIHGRNEELRRALFDFLRAIDLDPIEWSQAIALTGSGAPYIGDILDAAFKTAQALVVLLSPDDQARLHPDLQKPNDPNYERELTGQPRQNVLFEAGLAFGYKPDRTILVKVGDLRPFSDIYGRHEVRLTNGPETRQDLVNRLRNAGCSVDTEGKTDWLKAGDFKIDSSSKTLTETPESKTANVVLASEVAKPTASERKRAKTLSKNVYEPWQRVMINREGHILQLTVPVEPESEFEPDELPVEELRYFEPAQAYLKDKYPDAYAEWAKAKELLQEFQQKTAAFMVSLEESVRNQMKAAYPSLTEQTVESVPRSRINYYHLVNLSEFVFDVIFQDPSKLIVGRGEPPVFEVESRSDSDGRISLTTPEGKVVIETDEPEYNVNLGDTLMNTVIEPQTRRFLDDLYQTYIKLASQLRTFSQKLAPVIEKIELEL